MRGPVLSGVPVPVPSAPGGGTERTLYIAPFGDGERCDVEVVFDAAGRVCYADERPADRGVEGWLRERWEGPQSGGQLRAEHHPQRQRHVMRQPPLCGGCIGDADRDARGMLRLLNADEGAEPPTFPCDITTVTPPLCLSDARWAARACHGAADGFIAVRTREAEIIGVRGTVYSPTQPPRAEELVRFGDSRMNRVIARQTVIKLYHAERDESTLPMLRTWNGQAGPVEARAAPPR